MTTSEFVQKVVLKATGKATTLTSTDTKWTKIVGIANNIIPAWEDEADWNSLYDPEYSIGTVTATDTFDLDEEIRKISDTVGDNVRIVYDADNDLYTEWQVVSAERLKDYSTGNYCAQIGRTLKFNKTFASTDTEFGGTIEVPVYLHAELLTTASSEVPVDRPMWLVVMTAAEYVRNDITKQGQYTNLVAEANSLLEKMIDTNDGQIVEVSRPWSAG